MKQFLIQVLVWDNMPNIADNSIDKIYATYVTDGVDDVDGPMILPPEEGFCEPVQADAVLEVDNPMVNGEEVRQEFPLATSVLVDDEEVAQFSLFENIVEFDGELDSAKLFEYVKPISTGVLDCILHKVTEPKVILNPTSSSQTYR